MSQPLEISRGAWAAMSQMLGSGQSAGSSAGGSGRGGVGDSMVLIRNETGSALYPGQVVGLNGAINTPGAVPGWDFYGYYSGVKPDPDRFPFAIAAEYINRDNAGYAFVSGICKVKLYVSNKTHMYARPLADTTEWIESCAFGPAKMLYWQENNSEFCDGLIQFPIGESWDWGMVLVAYSGQLPAYSPLGIVNSGYTTTGTGYGDKNAEFLSRVSVVGEIPDDEHQDFVITLTDALGGDDTMVPALYSGICPALVNIENMEHTHAKPNGSGAMKSGFSGFAKIVHPVRALRRTGTQWCYVSIPATVEATLFPVVLKKVSGSAGDHNSQCSFVYDASAFPDMGDAQPLEKGIDPNGGHSKFVRPRIGKMREATFGMATRDAESHVILIWCNEVMEVNVCMEEE